jgi:hypothetical protein
MDEHGSINAAARTAITKTQIRASRAIYRFTDRGSRPRSQRRVFRLPVRPLGEKKFHVSVLCRLEREFNLVQTYYSS